MSPGQRPTAAPLPAQWPQLMEQSTMARRAAFALLVAAALAGCAPVNPGRPAAQVEADPLSTRYRCDDASQFTVRFADDSAVIDAPARDSEQLLRDAGGVTPQQTVYSNARLRAQFGLGERGNEALLHYLSPSLEKRCVRASPP